MESEECLPRVGLAISRKGLVDEVFEKDISYLPEYKGADDPFEGLLDRITNR